MRHVLHCTNEEQLAVAVWPERLCALVTVVPETRSCADDEKMLRLRLLSLAAQDPQLALLVTNVETMPIDRLPQRDVLRLCFVLGPRFLTVILGKLIAQAQSVDDVGAIILLNDIRSAVLHALHADLPHR